MQLTVLRYPGGKAKAVKHLKNHIPDGTATVVSPYFGGGALELHLAAQGVRIIANDMFEPLYNFWVTLQEHSAELIDAIRELKEGFDKTAFYACRERVTDTSRGAIERAAAYFALNRSSFSGSTLSGGYSASACSDRFTQSSIDRLADIHAVLSNIEFHNVDGVVFMQQHAHRGFVYMDPPYLLDGTGNKLYGTNGDMHAHFDHDALRAFLAGFDSASWLLSYNDSEAIRRMYAGHRIDVVTWSYGMNATKRSKEIIIRP